MKNAECHIPAFFESSQVTLETGGIFSESKLSTVLPYYAEGPTDSWRYQYVKRIIDLTCALVLILVFAIPGLLIAAAILLTSRGPIFYREIRIGRDGRLFRIWKFRSMRPHSALRARIAGKHTDSNVLEWRMRKQLRDPRITPIGMIIRSWSLDELPQLFNVVRGEMSLIGPRPIVETETRFYGNLLPFYMAAVPGLSGLWQVSGRSHVDYDQRARLDASYVQSWSLRNDLMILIRTIPAVLSRVGAH